MGVPIIYHYHNHPYCHSAAVSIVTLVTTIAVVTLVTTVNTVTTVTTFIPSSGN